MKLNEALRHNYIARKACSEDTYYVVEGTEDTCFISLHIRVGIEFRKPISWTNAHKVMERYGPDGWVPGWTCQLEEVRDEA